LVILGLGIYVYTILEKKYKVLENKYRKMSDHGKVDIIQVLFLGILVIVGIFSFSEAPYLLTDIIILCICLLIYKLLGEVDGKNLKMDLLFLLWFFTFFIMHSVTPVKVDRYIITVTPAMAYFTFLGLSVLI